MARKQIPRYHNAHGTPAVSTRGAQSHPVSLHYSVGRHKMTQSPHTANASNQNSIHHTCHISHSAYVGQDSRHRIVKLEISHFLIRQCHTTSAFTRSAFTHHARPHDGHLTHTHILPTGNFWTPVTRPAHAFNTFTRNFQQA